MLLLKRFVLNFHFVILTSGYVLSRLEGRIGSPERPLSDLGLAIYRNYWRISILTWLSRHTGRDINLRMLSEQTGIAISDIVGTLLELGMIKCIRTHYYIFRNQTEIERHLAMPFDATKTIDLTCLHLRPTNKSSLGVEAHSLPVSGSISSLISLAALEPSPSTCSTSLPTSTSTCSSRS